MQILDVVQGDGSWHDARAKFKHTASLASAIMGASKYKSRSDAIAYLATGITPEVDAATQRRFDEGHRIEALARPIAEKIIGKKLYPVTAISDDEYLLASYDGLSSDDTDWECKLWNETKAEDVRAGNVPYEDFWQVVHQLAVGAERCLYMVTDGTENKTVYCWLYRADIANEIDRLLASWLQVDIDVEEYKRKLDAGEIEQTKPKLTGEAIMDLPALAVTATGMVTYSNLPEFKAAAQQFIESINTELVTDQHFADAETTVKFCKTTEEKLEATKSAILAQTASIDEVIRTVVHIQAQLRDKRLMLDKLVKSEKEARKLAMCDKARIAFNDHFAALQAEISGLRLIAQHPDFGGAIKGLKKLDAMQDAIDTALANGKIEADAIAKDVRVKLAWCKDHAAGRSALFPDLQQLVGYDMDAFTALITGRIEKAKADEATKLEAERAKMLAEATAKAEREAAAKLAQEEARIRAEEQAKAKAEAEEQRGKLQVSEQRVNGVATMVESGSPDQVAESKSTQPDAVIQHQDVIAKFMALRDFGKDAGKIRAILVEFVKFQSSK